jgi:hypothetical protein
MRALECHRSQMDRSGPLETMASQVLEAVLGWEAYIQVVGPRGPAITSRTLLDGT